MKRSVGLVAAAFITFLGALVLIIVIGTNARAEGNAGPQQAERCAPLDQVRENLREKLGQMELDGGMHSLSTEDNPITVIFFVSADHRSWSQWVVNQDKQACYIMEGTSWFQGSLPVIGERWGHI